MLDVATTLYVELTGDDVAGDGTLANPYRTITRALASLSGITLVANVTIQVGAGDFAEPIEVNHPQGRKINIYGQPTVGIVTGIEEADFSSPLSPVPGVRGSNDLYNSAGMLPTDASSATRNAARSTDAVNNEALLRSIFPTRILPPSGTNGVYVTPDSAIGFFKDLLIIGGTVGITTHTTVFSITGQIALLNQASIGLQLTRNCSVNGSTVVVVNCALDAISATSDSSLDLTNIFIQGCGRYGLAQNSQGMIIARSVIATGCINSGIFINNARLILSSTVATKFHVTGCGSHGVVADATSYLSAAISGGGPNTVRFCGNSLHQIRILGGSFVYFLGSTTTITVQSGLLNTAAGINIDFNGSLTAVSSVVMHNGGYSVLAEQASRVSLRTLDVSTPPSVDVIRASEGAYVGIETSISLPNGFGTSSIRAQKGGQIHDSGDTLQALAVANPTKFIGPFGQRQSDGSCIFGGALNTASLSLLPTAVELAGQTASIKTGSTTPVEVIAVAANGDTTIKGVVSTNNDFESTEAGKGVLLRSPNGTRYRITVDDSGVVSAIAAP